MQRNHNTPQTGSTPIPLAVVRQWLDSHEEDTQTGWHYVAGLLAGCMIYREDIGEELTFLHSIAAIRANMTAKGNTSRFSTLTPKQRLDALSDAVSRMKSHSVVLSQFFTRPATKQAALEGMEAEIANLQVLWTLIRSDLQEVLP